MRTGAKVALVTGGAGGLGRAFSRRLAPRGPPVVVVHRARPAARGASGWRPGDAARAERVAHTTAPLAGARAGAPAPRTIRYRAGGLTVELELTTDALQGQLVPAAPGRVVLETTDGGIQDGEADDVGWFLFTPPPPAPFRLRVLPADRRAVVTAWTIPGVSAG